MSLIVETGLGLVDANSYATVAESDAYHATRLYATAWTGATEPNKAAALITATFVIDTSMRFNGFKKESTQALQWPRREAINPDNYQGRVPSYQQGGSLQIDQGWFPDDSLPPALVKATCELARELLAGNRLTDHEGQGIDSLEIFQALKVKFAKGDIQQAMPSFIQQILSKLGEFIGTSPTGGGVVKLRRV